MTEDQLIRVTFDTNVCNVIYDPNRWPDLVSPDDAARIRAAIADGRIAGFISEASLFVECLSFPDKLAYLSVAGTPDARPTPDQRALQRFSDLTSIGVRLLHAPLIGAEIFIEGFQWADDKVCPTRIRQERFFSFLRSYPLHKPLEAYGRSLLANQPPVPKRPPIATGPNSVSFPTPLEWAIALKRHWDDSDDSGRKVLENTVRPLISEWSDCLIVASHFAYANEIFCTTDQGKSGGSRSILHHTNRPHLESLGIKIMTPGELVNSLGL